MRTRDITFEVLRNLVRRKLRTALTVLGIVIGSLTVALVVALGSGLKSFIDVQISSLADPSVLQVLGAEDLPVTKIVSTAFGRLGRPPKQLDKSGFNPGAFNLRYLSEDEVAGLRKIPHVISVKPATFVFVNYIQLENDDRKFEVVVIPEGEGFRMELEAGPGFSRSGEPEVVLAHQYLEAFKIKDPTGLIGRKVRFGVSRFPLTMKGASLSALLARKDEKVFEARVVGLAEKTLLSMAAYVDHKLALEIARHFLDDPELHTPGKFGLVANVRVDSAGNAPVVKKAVQKMGLTAVTMQERIGFLDTIFFVMQTGLSVFGFIALVVAGLGIANTLLMATYERRREIGLLKALGMTSAGVRTMFALEATIMGLLGGAIGLAVAYTLGKLGNMLAQYTFASAWEGLALFAFPWWLFLGIMVFSAVVGLLAGLYPAVKASRLDPIAALRSE